MADQTISVPAKSLLRRMSRTARCRSSGFGPWSQTMMSASARMAETS